MFGTTIRHAMVKWAFRGAALLLLVAAGAAAGVLYGWTQVARGLPALQGWHTQAPASEFRASDAQPGYDFEAYRRQESRVFDELDHLVAAPGPVKREAGSIDSAPRPPVIRPRSSTRTGTVPSCSSRPRPPAARCSSTG